MSGQCGMHGQASQSGLSNGLWYQGSVDRGINQSEMVTNWGIRMADKILEKMKKGVYYPGNYLGRKTELSTLEERGYLQRMDGSFLCGPDSEPNYCLTDKGLHNKGQNRK